MDLITDGINWIANPANWQGRDGIPTRLLEHVGLSGVSLLVAMAIALPIGLAIGHTGRGATLAINIANLGRALPSLAVIAVAGSVTVLLDPQLGFKLYSTLIGMVVLATPPILVNAYAGITGVDRELVDAARGMGMREVQILRRIEIPIALPVIVGGIRSGAVQIIATATLGAIFGSGGLGRYLIDGISQGAASPGKIFGGVILIAGLALFTEGAFVFAQRRMISPGLRASGPEAAARSGSGQAAGA